MDQNRSKEPKPKILGYSVEIGIVVSKALGYWRNRDFGFYFQKHLNVVLKIILLLFFKDKSYFWFKPNKNTFFLKKARDG